MTDLLLLQLTLQMRHLLLVPDDLIQLMSMRMRIMSMKKKEEEEKLHLLDPEHCYTLKRSLEIVL